MVNQMADLRRQGFTFKDIAARLGCSERTVRRYVGHVAIQVEAPRDELGPDADLDRTRAWLMEDFTSLLADEFDLAWSMTLIDEAHYRLARRLARTHPYTLRLMAQDREKRWRFYAEVVGPLYHDLGRLDPRGIGSVEVPPYFTPPFDRLERLQWTPEPDDESFDNETASGEGLP